MAKIAKQTEKSGISGKHWFQTPVAIASLIISMLGSGFAAGRYSGEIKQDINERKLRIEFEDEYRRLKSDCENDQINKLKNLTDALIKVDETFKNRNRNYEK